MLGIVLVRRRITEISDLPIFLKTRDIAALLLNDPSTPVLALRQHNPKCFGLKPGR